MLRLVNVVNDLAAFAGPEVAIYSDQVLQGLQAHGRAVLAEAEQAARTAGVDAETRCIETAGEGAGDAIVAEARAWKADLIVIGTHGRRGLRRLVLGSDAETVVRTAPVPVLLVRATERSPT
jgi:nucleotide-binding universal stress UspA family protein